jgi:hypothetical protein
VEPQQNSASTFVPLAEAEGQGATQNVSSTCQPSATSFWNPDDVMRDSAYMQAAAFHYDLEQQGPGMDMATPATDFQFVSGCRPLERSGARPASPK